MPDITVAAEALGAYEVPLTANTPQVLRFTQPAAHIRSGVQLMVHGATEAVYARVGTTVTVKDPKAIVALPNSWVDIALGYGTQSLTVISAGDAVISVSKQ
jgi:hypothetical protein